MKSNLKANKGGKTTPVVRTKSKNKTNNPKSWTSSSPAGKIFVITGPSGSGKTTIAQAILKEMNFFKRVVTCVTRPMREGERQDIDYHFISKEKFEEYLAKDELMEHDFHYGHYYGILKKDVEEIMLSGKSVLLLVDVNGALTIKKKFPDVITLFIKAPSIDVLRQRLLERKKDSLEVIEQRLEIAKKELTLENKFDFVVVNADLKKAIMETKKIILESISPKKA